MLVGFAYQARVDRILFDVRTNAVELGCGSYQVIVAFVLPKCLAVAAQQLIRAIRRKPFQRRQPSRRLHPRGNEKMHVIGHDHVRMKLVTVESPFSIMESRYHHPCQFRSAEAQRSVDASVQQPIHRYECSARPGHAIGREQPMRGKTAAQTKRDKQRLIDSVPVRKAPLVVSHPEHGVRTRENFSEIRAAGRLKGGCGQDWPPHTCH